MPFTSATVQHSFTNPDGSSAVGEAQWTLTKAMTNGSSTILPLSFASPITNGTLSASLTPNLDAGTDPPDSQWRVDIRLAGMAPLSYFITVPSATFTAATVSGQPTLFGVSSFRALAPGQTITGTGIPGATTILSVNPTAGTALMSNNATASGTLVPITISALTMDLGLLLPSEGTTVPMDISTQWQTYLDVNLDVKPYLQIDRNNAKYDKNLRTITTAACVAVQQWIQKPVPPTTFNRKFDGMSGWHGSYIELPYYPVLQIVNVTEFWGGSGPHTLVEQTPEAQGGGDMYQVDRLTGQIRRSFAGLIERPFFPGSRNVEVTWIAGYNPIPDDIRWATLEWINTIYRGTQEAERVARPQMEYDEAPNTSLNMPPHVARILQQYKSLIIG